MGCEWTEIHSSEHLRGLCQRELSKALCGWCIFALKGTSAVQMDRAWLKMTQPLYNTTIKFSASCSPSPSAKAQGITAINLRLSSGLQLGTPGICWVFNHASVNALGKNSQKSHRWELCSLYSPRFSPPTHTKTHSAHFIPRCFSSGLPEPALSCRLSWAMSTKTLSVPWWRNGSLGPRMKQC